MRGMYIKEQAKGLALSFAITIAAGIIPAVAFAHEDPHTSFIGMCSQWATLISSISFLVYNLVTGIHSMQYLRFGLFGGRSRKSALISVLLGAGAVIVGGSAVLLLLTVPYTILSGSTWLMVDAFLYGLSGGALAYACGMLFALMPRMISSKVAAGFAIALLAIIYSNVALNIQQPFGIIGGKLALMALAAATLAINAYLILKRHASVGSTALN